MPYIKKSMGLLVLFSLIGALLVWMVIGDVGAIILSSINNSGGNFDQGGGFLVYSTSGLITNGTSLTLDTLPAADPFTAVLNLSGVININLSILNKTAAQVLNVTNVTFSWILNYNGSIMLNATVSNLSSGAATGIFNLTFNTNTLPDGIYNISVYLHNFTLDPTNANTWPFNLSRAYGVAIDRTPPNVTNFWANVSNRTNLTTSVAKIEVNISTNDSTTYVPAVKIGVRNGTSEMNLTATRNASAFVAVIVINASIGQDRFDVFAYPNDSMGNLNFTNGNFSFTVDGTAPALMNFSVMYRGVASGNLTNISNTTPTFYFNFSDNLSISANCTVYVNTTLSVSNGATVNVTMTTQTATTALAEGHHISYLTCTDGSGNQGNNTDALTPLSATRIVFVSDSIPPPVTLWANVSNTTNLTTSAAKIEVNISTNDSTTYVQIVKIGVRNGTNEINLTASRFETARFGVFVVNISINATLGQDRFSVFAYANDSVSNLNFTTGNFSFTVDGTAPALMNFSVMYRGVASGNLTNISNNTPTFYFNFSDNLSISANCTVYVNTTLSVSNGATVNVTMTTQTATTALAEGHHISYLTCTDGSGNQGNNTDALTPLSATRIVFVSDSIPPNVTLWANVSNTTNLTTSAAKIEVNISSNDSTTYTQVVKIGVRNATNEMNITATKNASYFGAVIIINASIGQDRFDVFAYVNDSVGNLNFTTGNFSFTVDGTAPSYNLFHMFGRNGSTVNLTNLSATSADFRFNFTDNLSISANCTLYVNSTLASSNSSSVNSTATNLTATSMAEGKHIAYVSCTDGAGNVGNTTSDASALGALALTFTVDTIPPNLSAETLIFGNYSGYAGHDGRYVGINLSRGLSEGNYTLMVFVNDTSTHPQMVRFNLSNGSGTLGGSHYPFNHTAVKNESNYTTGDTGTASHAARGNFNVSKLAEGWYNLTVWTNDSVDNVNSSLRLSFVIDRTLPSVSVTCTPANPTAGQTVTCTCTHTDNYPGSGILAATAGFGTGSDTESTTATGSGSFTSGECRARDYAGNLGTATGSWTVTAASSGGGGGGGSGGGSSSGVSGQFEKEVWTSINAGETAKVEVANGAIGVTEISFTVAENTYGAWVQVKKVDSLPSSVEAFDKVAYRTLEITQQNVQKALQGQATVKFKVEKSWLTDNSVSTANVALFRYVDGDWTALPTTMGEDDGTYVHYSAMTSGFSYFVIGEAEAAAAAAVEEVAPVAGEVPVEEETGAAEAPEGAVVKKKSNAAVWIVPLVVLVVIAGLLYWYWKRK